ncbi:MAG: AI-2E family transporter [Candidatus Nanopelagicales bacterium]
MSDEPPVDGAVQAPPEDSTEPPWLMSVITRSMWRAVLIVLAVLALLWALNQARDLVVMGIVACFLALAILPAVDGLVRRHSMSRGLATLLVMLGVFLTITLLIGFLVPALVDVFSKVSAEVPTWLDQVRKLGLPIPLLEESDAELMADFQKWLQQTGGHQALSIAGSGVGLLAKVFVTFVFTIIIASGEPAILRAILSRLGPSHQLRLIDAWETAIQQTGGYFYSRLLLMFFTSTGYLIVMLLVGMPWLFAIPLAVFGAFFVEFIPLVGGYIGIAIPVIFVLVEKGLVRALILLAWAVIYQQIHDYVLSPRISSRTMTLSPGIALGSALVGGAIAGPLGALFAMPTAGMVTAFLTKYLPSQPIVVSPESLAVPRGRQSGKHKSADDHPTDSNDVKGP